MIKIEVRENKIFELGYPYNSSVDSYFKSLTTDFIKNYGLDNATVLEINNHKNTTLTFDRKLHDLAISLSAFIVEFENNGQGLIDTFNTLIEKRDELQNTKDTMLVSKTNAEEEYTFIISNIDQLNSDIEKVNEFITYYQGQVFDDSYSYSDTYITDTQNSLLLLTDIISQNEVNFEYYKNTLYTHINSFVLIKDSLRNYSFIATTLRSMYEEWQKRPELFYQNLVNYFTDQYNQYWTYGSSLMYGEKLEEDTASTIIFNSIASRWQETLFKRYHFSIDKEVKEYSLTWLSNHTSFEEEEFLYAIESKKVEIYTRELILLEQMVNDKRTAVRSVIPYDKEQNYYRYREYVLDKIKYLYMTVNTTIDQSIIDNYDLQISNLQSDYDYVVTKFSQVTYWKYKAEFEMYTELVTEIQRNLDNSERAISREFKKSESDSTVILEKIAFYESEKSTLQLKLDDLTTIREKLEIENALRNDEITIIDSNYYENETLIQQKRNEYVLFFNNRIQFFMKDTSISENENIIILLEGGYFNDLDETYNIFENYSHDVEWYSVEDRTKLKLLYSNILNIIKTNFLSEWDSEFSSSILDTKKITFYEYYFDKELRLFYALINKHILDGVYNSVLFTTINTQLIKVKNIFLTYVNIAFNIKSNISVITNLFDYTDKLEFTISEGNEEKENVIDTFNTIVNDILTFSYNKNIEFKVLEDSVDKQEKIDQIWLDMEKKYV